MAVLFPRQSSPNQAGPYAAFLGSGYDPFWTDFSGNGTVVVPPLNAEQQTERVRDPRAGIESTARLQLAQGCQLTEEVPSRRFDARVSLLDETLVICTSEHGRTPKIDSGPIGGARHHWSRAYSSVFAGGGMARGRIVGETDAIGGDVADAPISPKDMQAAVYQLMGYAESETIPDRQGRPHPIAGDGRSRPELLACIGAGWQLADRRLDRRQAGIRHGGIRHGEFRIHGLGSVNPVVTIRPDDRVSRALCVASVCQFPFVSFRLQ